MIISDSDFLKKKSDKIDISESASLIHKLEQELNISALHGAPGIGLAAPQIGVLKRVAIIRIPSTGYKNLYVNLVNPEIVQKYDKAIFQNEGCLSFPGINKKTWRYQEIVVKNDIKPYLFIATGLFAVCIQHEMDHLDGIILPDLGI